MFTVMRKLRAEEDGITLTELMVATVVLALILGAVYGVLIAFYRNVRDQELKTTAQRQANTAMTGIVINLRQALDLSDIGQPVLELQSIAAGDATDKIVFQSDRMDFQGPEEYTYELRNCAANRCELWQDTRWADAPFTEPYVYPAVPDQSRVILEDVVTGGSSLFRGARWLAGTKTFTDSCDGSPGNQCSFPLVDVSLRVDPDVTRDVPGIIEIREEVRIRNARS